MTRKHFFLSLLLTTMMGVAGFADKPVANSPAPDKAPEKAKDRQVIAYYFHGTVRCETCQKIERLARESIERRFAPEMLEKRLVFMPVNFDKPENAHFLADYKLPCPSLVVVWQKSAKDRKWKLLEKTWEHVENPFQFNEYIETEVGKFLLKAK